MSSIDSSEKDLQARYLAWKKNAPHLYDTILAFELPWPSLSVEWLPEVVRKEQPRTRPGAPDVSSSVLNSRQRLLLTTNTGGVNAEYLRIGELITPEIPQPQSLGEYDADQGTVGNYQPMLAADLRIVQRIQVNGVIERARYMPQNSNIVATISNTGEAAIWDVTKFPYKPINHYMPTVKLVGHTAEAVSLSWSPVHEGTLATGDGDGEIFIWDMREEYDSSTGQMAPKRSRHHAPKTAVNALAWHPRREATLASCGDDGWLYIHSTVSEHAPAILSYHFNPITTETTSTPANDTAASLGKPTALAWNPVNDSLLAVGLDTGKIILFDVRSSPPVELISYSGPNAHTGYITSLSWNSWHPAMLASSSDDGTTKIWNAATLENKPLFTHGGHKSAVTDVSWNPGFPGMLASVAEDNGLHIYQPADDILGF